MWSKVSEWVGYKGLGETLGRLVVLMPTDRYADGVPCGMLGRKSPPVGSGVGSSIGSKVGDLLGFDVVDELVGLLGLSVGERL